MLQLIHDIAPASPLGFATAFNGNVNFADNIVRLRTEFGADVIVDDVIYFDEPIYSDGLIAQAVDTVASLGAAYFSSAGNNGNDGYESTYRPVSRSSALSLVRSGQQNLNLLSVSPALAESFHDFDPGSGVDISQTITIPEGVAAPLTFQWNEPFNLGKVLTDYNLLVFNESGRFVRVLSGTDNNPATDQPLEIVQLPAGTYQIVLARANSGPASQIKYIAINTAFDGEYLGASTTFGHSVARGGQSVGAIFWGTPTVPEEFTSLGPATIFFDTSGTLLPQAEVRQVPQISGVDGTSTTFFSGAPGANGFPSFFGTSAAAPNVAAVAALLLEVAGGPGTLTPAQVYSTLQGTAADVPLDADPGFSQLSLTSGGGITLSANGSGSTDPNFFRIGLGGVTGTVNQLVLDVSAAGLVFDQDATVGFPFTVGTTTGVSASDVTATLSADRKTLTLTFAPGSFGAGDALNFGIDRDYAATFSSGNSADLLVGATAAFALTDGTAAGVFVNAVGPAGFDNFTGFGLVDAQNAVQNLP
jgi:hypothetical protein